MVLNNGRKPQCTTAVKINELRKKPCLLLFSLYKQIELQCKKTHFINNKHTPEFQENIASYSSVQCSSWPFNNQFTAVVH
jgi:hypothetical protein